ncbi:MAG: hypothetical protein GXY74_16205 [Phycisphaerae bacterium]|nr:hypothetical protein [Phycisphaerae bacterium]
MSRRRTRGILWRSCSMSVGAVMMVAMAASAASAAINADMTVDGTTYGSLGSNVVVVNQTTDATVTVTNGGAFLGNNIYLGYPTNAGYSNATATAGWVIQDASSGQSAATTYVGKGTHGFLTLDGGSTGGLEANSVALGLIGRTSHPSYPSDVYHDAEGFYGTGTLTIQSGTLIITAANYANDRNLGLNVAVGASGCASCPTRGTVVQTGGDVYVGGGLNMGWEKNYNIGSGSVSQYLISDGTLTVDGTAYLGQSYGRAAVLFQVTGSAATIELANLTTTHATLAFVLDNSSQHISTIAATNATIGSDTTVHLDLDGFTPGLNDTFDLLTVTNGTLTLSQFSLADGDEESWALQLDATGKTLQAVCLVDSEPPSAAYPTPPYLMSYNFEVGDLAHCRNLSTANNGTVVLSTAVRHSGRYAAQCALPATATTRKAYLLGQFTHAPREIEGSSLYMRAYIYLGSDFTVASGTSVSILSFGGFAPPPNGQYTGNVAEVAIRSASGNLVLGQPTGQGSAAGSTVLQRQQWYCVEACLTVDGANSSLAVSLDGAAEYGVTGMSVSAMPDGICAGLLSASSSGTAGSLVVDDIMINDQPIGMEDLAVLLNYPCFVSRVGAPVVAILTGDQAGDSLQVTLTSSLGLNRTVCEQEGPLGGRVDFTVDLHDLPAADYTLTAVLLDSSEQERARAEYRYRKDFSGDPEFTIDAANNILQNGEKFFPVTAFGLSRQAMSAWRDNRYCNNMLLRFEWNPSLLGPDGFEVYLDAAEAIGMKDIGPDGDYRFGFDVGDPRFTVDAVIEYLTELKDHPAIAWWMWQDEPINWGFTSAEVKSWFDAQKELDPGRLNEVLHMGDCYQIGLLRAESAYQTFPFLCADVYSWDIYPIENELYSGGTFVDYAKVADRAVNWNMGLVPVIVNVAVSDVVPNSRGGMPTPDEIAFVAWLSIVHKAKGVHWYPYNAGVPDQNYEAMTRFVDQVTDLTEAILGDDAPVAVTCTSLTGGRIDMRATTDGSEKIYIFAVNLERTTQSARFTVAGLAADEEIKVYGEDRSLTSAAGGTFEDAFSQVGVHIYVIGDDEDPPPDDTVTVRYPIAAGNDDMECTPWGIYLDSTRLSFPYDNVVRPTFMRWQLDIPVGSVVNSAHIEVWSDSNTSTLNPTVLRFQIIDSDSCPEFTSSPYSWTLCAGEVDWTMEPWTANMRYFTPDLTSLVQGFIDRQGYEPDNYVGLRFSYVSGVSRHTWAYEYNTAKAPVLVVNYTPPEE